MIERIVEAVKRALLPELEKLGGRLDRMEGQLGELSQRLGDLNDHIVRLDQRIDQTKSMTRWCAARTMITCGSGSGSWRRKSPH